MILNDVLSSAIAWAMIHFRVAVRSLTCSAGRPCDDRMASLPGKKPATIRRFIMGWGLQQFDEFCFREAGLLEDLFHENPAQVARMHGDPWSSVSVRDATYIDGFPSGDAR